MTSEVVLKVVLVVSSNGFHPTEYSEPKRILENSGVTVITASDKAGTAIAKDGTTTQVDVSLNEISDEDFDALFFIGGQNLECIDSKAAHELIQKTAEAKKPFGAICASVRILANADVLAGKKITGWNGDGKLPTILETARAIYTPKDVVVDSNIITAIGPNSDEEFGARILEALGQK